MNPELLECSKKFRVCLNPKGEFDKLRSYLLNEDVIGHGTFELIKHHDPRPHVFHLSLLQRFFE